MIPEPPAIAIPPIPINTVPLSPLKEARDEVIRLREQLHLNHEALRAAYTNFVRIGFEAGFGIHELDGLFGRIG